MLKKITTLILLIFILFITSCTEVVTTCTVTVNDGTNTTEYTINKGDNLTFLESPTKFKHQFAGWYDGDKLINVNNPVEEDLSIEAKFEYVYNQTGFDGNGMEYNILLYDNLGNINDRFCIKKELDVTSINEKYNINIKYEKYPMCDKSYSTYYNVLYQNDFCKKNNLTTTNNINAVVGMNVGTLLNSMWNENYPDKLSEFLILDDGTENSIFKQYGYTQSEFASSQVTIDGNVYGYNPNVEYINYGLMAINKDVIKKYNLEDPYEMYLNGEWTFSNFQKWIEDAYNLIDKEKIKIFSNSITYDALYLYQNFAAALGYPLAEDPKQTSLSAEVEEHYDLGSYIKSLYYNYRKSYDYVYDIYVDCLIQSVFSIEYYTSIDEKKSREDYYFMPYPMADDQQGELILSNDSNDAQYNVYGNAITDSNGNYITAIDLTNTTFKINVNSYCNAFFIKKVEDNDYGLTNDISFEIIYDLIYINNLSDIEDNSYNNFKDVIYEVSRDSINKIDNTPYVNIINYSNCYYDQTLSIAYEKYGTAVTFKQCFQDSLEKLYFDKENIKSLLNLEFTSWMHYY